MRSIENPGNRGIRAGTLKSQSETRVGSTTVADKVRQPTTGKPMTRGSSVADWPLPARTNPVDPKIPPAADILDGEWRKMGGPNCVGQPPVQATRLGRSTYLA